MTNSSDRQPPKREVFTDADGNSRLRETRYHNNYDDGREVEERLFVNQRVRGGPGPGLLIGIALAALLGVGIIVWYLLSQSSNQPPQQIIVPENEVPTAPQAPPAPVSPPDVNITVPSVEVPQAPQSPAPPDVNITVPSVEAPQTSQESPSSSPQNNGDTTAPSSQPGTTNTTPTSPSNSTTSPSNSSTSSPSNNSTSQGQ